MIVNAAGGIDPRDGPDLADLAERWLADYRTNVLTAVLLTEALLDRLRVPGAG